jgi:PleD family two-component response regulator
MASTRVAVLEPSAAERRRLQQGLVKAGLKVTDAEAPEALTREGLVVLGPSIVRVGPSVKQVRAQAPKALILAARRELQKVSGVDGLLPLPISPLDLAVRVPELLRLRALQEAAPAKPQTPAAPAVPVAPITDPDTHFSTYEHYREVLLVEVKRARRYGFPLSVALLALDPLPIPSSREVRTSLYGGLALSIRRSLRDTDFPVQYSRDRVLLVMPHTDAAGALVVSRRICERVGRASLMVGDTQVNPTVSVGVASVEAGADRTLGDVIGQAQAGLEAAQAWGGGRVELGEPAGPVNSQTG